MLTTFALYIFSVVFSKKAGGGGDGGGCDGGGVDDDDDDDAIMLLTLSPQIPALHYYTIMANTSIMAWLFEKSQWFTCHV